MVKLASVLTNILEDTHKYYEQIKNSPLLPQDKSDDPIHYISTINQL
jgi:hypothetical protein